MARTTQLLQIFSLLLLTFILSSRQTQAKPTAVHIGNGDGGGSVDDDGNGDANGNVGGGSSSEESSVETEEDHLLSDLRVSTYLALTRFCQQCSFVIDDLQKPLIRTGSREIEMANSIRDNLVCIYVYVYPFFAGCRRHRYYSPHFISSYEKSVFFISLD